MSHGLFFSVFFFIEMYYSAIKNKIMPFSPTWHNIVSHLSWNKVHNSYHGNGVILPDVSLKYILLFFYVLLSDTAKLGYFLFLKKKEQVDS